MNEISKYLFYTTYSSPPPTSINTVSEFSKCTTMEFIFGLTIFVDTFIYSLLFSTPTNTSFELHGQTGIYVCIHVESKKWHLSMPVPFANLKFIFLSNYLYLSTYGTARKSWRLHFENLANTSIGRCSEWVKENVTYNNYISPGTQL